MSTMTLPGPPFQSGPCTGWGENTELVGSDLPQSVQQPGRQAGRQQRAAVGGEPPGRQAGRQGSETESGCVTEWLLAYNTHTHTHAHTRSAVSAVCSHEQGWSAGTQTKPTILVWSKEIIVSNILHRLQHTVQSVPFIHGQLVSSHIYQNVSHLF